PRLRGARPGILLWTAHRAAERQHADSRLVPGYLPPAAELLRRVPGAISDGPDAGGPGRLGGPGLPGPSGAGAGQLCPHPECALGGPALVPEVRRHPRPGLLARRPAGPGDPDEALRSPSLGIPVT